MRVIDNINDLLGDELKQTLQPDTCLKIAASCFSMYAFEALKAELEKIDRLNFIFTSPAFVADEVTDKVRKEWREFHISKLDRESSLYGSEFEIQLRNKLTQRAVAKECAEWIRRKAKFKSNRTKESMQKFACVQTGDTGTVYMPIEGFTAVTLGYQKGDAISNLVNKMDGAPFAATYLSLFNQIWNDPERLEDVTEQICEQIASVYKENSPESIYSFMLFNIFRNYLDNLDEDTQPKELTGYRDTLIWNKLFNFQKDAATAIINKLETYNGCILADSVGLGKTFTALAVIKYYELRNHKVLVLCPKRLADNWLNYNRNLKTNIFARDRFHYDVLYHTDLSRTSGESCGTRLDLVNWGNYDLVVIDESHNFRNSEVQYKDKRTRYQILMDKVIREGVKTKVLMLSATPVNNRFADLRSQLALAYEGNSENLAKKLCINRSIEDIFRRAQAAFNKWVKLPAEERTKHAIFNTLDFDFLKLLDSVTIARSRKHIQTFYDTKDIGTFPERLQPESFMCPLTELPDILDFNGISKQLARLNMAVYAPISYVLSSRLKKYEEMYDTKISGNIRLTQADREKYLQALMRVILLKRLESSVQSFRLTLESLQESIANTLKKISDFNKHGGTATVGSLTSLEDADDDDWAMQANENSQTDGKININLADMDLPSWEGKLNEDLEVVKALLASMNRITPPNDAKLQHLKQQLFKKINNPINPGNRKVIIFTAFADTADYLYDNLAEELLSVYGIHTAKVTGSSKGVRSTIKKDKQKRSYGMQELLTLFSPRSKEKAVVLPDEPLEIDLLIGTDCISEGQNLQDCDYLVNYDIHWNPVRIIQRFGRIDRIGSPNSSIQLVNYWPDITLDQYIKLKERVENRMQIADLAATGDDNVLETGDDNVSYRAEQLHRLKNEVVELEDLKTGVSITDLGLNDFRMDVLNYIKIHDNLDKIPKGIHAVVPAAPEKGLQEGVIFTLRNRNVEINLNQQNRLHPYYLIYISRTGEIVYDHTEAKRLLDLARACCKGQSEPVMDECRYFNKETADGSNMQLYSDLLGKSIRSMIKAEEESDIDSLFSAGGTTALTGTVSGLDDFELISFLIIQDRK